MVGLAPDRMRELRSWFVGCLLWTSSWTFAADRIVLIQSAAEERIPSYVTIAGGRVSDHECVVMKTGRHAPADEWIMREVRPGIFSFQSNDPFYPASFLNLRSKPVELFCLLPIVEKEPLKFEGILLRRAIVRPERFLLEDNLWRLVKLEGDAVSLCSEGPTAPGLFLHRVTIKDDKFSGVLFHPLVLREETPEWESKRMFRILDLPPSKPSGQGAPKAD